MADIFKRAWAEVNLDNVAYNIQQIKKLTNEDTKIMAMVKADAYGHGFLEVSKTLLANGADCLAVAFLDEAKQLRRFGVEAPILILGHTPYQWVQDLVDLDITQTVYQYEMAEVISQVAAASNKQVNIHIKVDTGMTRIGLTCNQTAVETIGNIAKLPGINIEGIFTHFSSADEAQKDFTEMQFAQFINLCEQLKTMHIDIPIKHVCNSAGMVQFSHMHLDMVRPGVMLYGLYPSEEVKKEAEKKIILRPAMALKASIVQIKKVPAGVPVSYGRSYVTNRDTVVGTIPIGYADGYSRMLTHKAKMIVGNQVVPVIGKICMDYCMIDVTDVKDIKVGDEVMVFGRKEGVDISIEQIAVAMGTINYEVVCIVGKRVPRVYIQNEEIIEVLNYLA